MPQKKQSMYKQVTYWLGVIIVGLTTGLGIQFTQAWVNPPNTPPQGNVMGPITIGDTPQYRKGLLGIRTTAIPTYALEVGGSAVFAGKARSSSTLEGDSKYTLVTKDYIDAQLKGVGDNLGNHLATKNLNMSDNYIVNLTDPKSPQDAATKAYVDRRVSVPGPKGDKGDQGSAGSQGPVGPQGPAGNSQFMNFFKGYGCNACPYGSSTDRLAMFCSVRKAGGTIVTVQTMANDSFSCAFNNAGTWLPNNFAFWSY